MIKLKKWVIGVGVLVVLGIIGNFLPESDVEETVKPVSKENKEEEIIDVTNLSLNDSKYIDTIKLVNKDIDKVEINEKTVSIYFKQDMSVWSEKNLVKDMAIDGAKIFEKAFENKNANEVELIFKTKFTDEYGKEELKDAINVVWSRETSDQVKYDNYENILYQDYTKFYMISDKYSIHPSIYSKLDSKDKLSMEM